MVRKSVSKVNSFPIFVEDMESMWGYIRFTDAFHVFYTEESIDNKLVHTPGGAPITTGTIGPTTVTNTQAYGYYKIMLLGTGDMSSCTLAINRTIQDGDDEIGRWFSVDETTFTYTITVLGTVSIEKVIIVGMRYNDTGITLYSTLS